MIITEHICLLNFPSGHVLSGTQRYAAWNNILTRLSRIKTCKALKSFEWSGAPTFTRKSSHHWEILHLCITVSCRCQCMIWGVTGGMQTILLTRCKFGSHAGGTQTRIASAEKRKCKDKLFLWKASKQFSYDSEIWVDILILEGRVFKDTNIWLALVSLETVTFFSFLRSVSKIYSIAPLNVRNDSFNSCEGLR